MTTSQVDKLLSQLQKDAKGSRLDVYTPRSAGRGQGGISGNGRAGGGRGRFGGGGMLGRGK